MKKKKPPYGISNYESLITDNYYYVDKTGYIQLLEEAPEKSVFFLRPRKFGKSLFVSMLQYYYGVEYKDKFDKLFGDYYIGKNPTEKANKYYVVSFDFSAILTETPETTFESFNEKVIVGINYFNNTHNLFNQEIIENIVKHRSASDIMNNFITINT